MCLIAFKWNPQDPHNLLVVANRDEFYARPTARAHWWQDANILAGKDLQGGGTWLGVSRSGRMAALTNYRDPARFKPGAKTRGTLVTGFLDSTLSQEDYLSQLRGYTSSYNDFNLLLYDGYQLLAYESANDRVIAFETGVHGVSNAYFDTPWPKLQALKEGMMAHSDDAAVFKLLSNADMVPDEQLPQTGVPLNWERALSPAFIHTPEYGTRASTIVRITQTHVSLIERSFENGHPSGESCFAFVPVDQ